MSHKRILALGYQEAGGARQWAISHGLQEHGIEVVECFSVRSGLLGKLWDFFCAYRRERKHIDAVLITFPGQYIVLPIWLMTRKPLIIDMLISQHDTLVDDRKVVRPHSLKAHLLFYLDRLSFRLTDCALVDTPEHKDFFAKQFGADTNKMMIVPISTRTDIFHASNMHAPESTTYTVGFYGTFIPLQGIDVIIDAAAKLPDIQFIIIGKGQTYASMQQKADELQLENIEWTGALPMREIPVKLARADICLGIFGTTNKANRVIPHKAYDILAMGKPLITGDTTAARNWCTPGKDALLVPVGDSDALAAAITDLRDDPVKRKEIASAGHALFEEKFLPGETVKSLAKWLATISS